MKNLILSLSAALAISILAVSTTRAHCEVPCGIFDDAMRIEMILENCDTIEKAMKKISSGEENENQTVRWVVTKEEHAVKIQDIVSRYFMAQRVKPGMEGTTEKLELLHGILVAAMKCKHGTDTENVAKVRDLTAKFKTAYFGPEEAADDHAGHDHDGHTH